MLSPGLFEKKKNLHFRSLITIQISQQSPILTQKKQKKKKQEKTRTNCSWKVSDSNFWPKRIIWNSTYKKLKFENFLKLCLYFH